MISKTFFVCHANFFNDSVCGYVVFGQINHKLNFVICITVTQSMKPISPTPWRSIENPSEVNFTHTILDSEGERLARVCSLTRTFGRQRDEGANAFLMAAAPDLYESLQSCAATLLAQGITGPAVAEATRLLDRLRTQLGDHA